MAKVKCFKCKKEQNFSFYHIFKCIYCEHYKFEYMGKIFRSGADGGKTYNK